MNKEEKTLLESYMSWIKTHDQSHPNYNLIWEKANVLIEIERQKHD